MTITEDRQQLSPPNKKAKAVKDVDAAAPIPAAVSDDTDAQETPSINHNWNDPRLDHHFGMESSTAHRSYTNRGRTDAVLKTLKAYGFVASTDTKSKKAFDGGFEPSVCFECYVRKHVGLAHENGELPGKSIGDLAFNIRKSHLLGYENEATNTRIDGLEDRDLVKEALSAKGITDTGLFYSFCRDDLEEFHRMWHCRICRVCVSWHDWHCKGCNKCQYGESIPCEKCKPNEFASWKEASGCW